MPQEIKRNLTQKDLILEICKREVSKEREVNITEVSRVLRHTFEILSEMTWIDMVYFMDKRMQYYQNKVKGNKPITHARRLPKNIWRTDS